MKKILYIFALVALMLATSCSRQEELISHEGQGSVSFALSSNAVRNTPISSTILDTVKDKLMFRIYSVSNKGQQNETQSLVRLYTYDEIIGDGSSPMQIWLLAGDYRISVEGGEKSEASFTDIYYKGVTDFTVEESMNNQQIQVVCRPANVMVKVIFDESVMQNLGQTGNVTVAFADAGSYSEVESEILSKSLPSLTYDGTAVGYFCQANGDEWPSQFVWRFAGTVASKGDQDIVKDGVYTPAEGFKAGYMYTLTFKYSPDLGGYITLNVNVKTEFDEEDIISSTATFKPEPQFETGVEVAEGYENVTGKIAQMYSGKRIGYSIKAISAISEVKINVSGEELTYTSSQIASSASEGEPTYTEYRDETNGVTIRVFNDKEWKLLLDPAFSQKLGAGKQTYFITVTDDSAAIAEYVQDYVGEGVRNLTITAGKEWDGEAKFTADIFNPNADVVTLYYKDKSEGGEYKSVQMIGGVATVTGLGGARVYDAYVSYTLKDQGAPVTTKHNELLTPNGKQIPNGNMETWSSVSSKNMLLPFVPSINSSNFKDYAGLSTTWDTGNHGAATLGNNVTTNSTTAHSGSYSAYLKSQFVGMIGIGKFAAGNLFYGSYLATDGTNGTIGFGQPFTYDFKPRALRVWYKGRVGTCDYAGGPLSKGNSDKAQIYVWLCNWTGRHAISTSDTSTFINPATTATTGEGNIVGYGVWSREITSSDNGGDQGWQMIEIPITYREGEGFTGVIPNYLVISCAASAYGDYFAGSTDSYMYVDDFEFVY